ncbi:location of vulva defective 1 [Coregonus clupeaformis]|nr:location of vulva defective 1 [Coregonus clupeaformis]
MYVYKKEDINLPSAFLEEVLKVSGLLPTTVAPTTTTTTVASTTAIKTAGPPTTTTIVLPTTTTATLTSTSMSSVTSTTRFGTVMFFVRLMFQLNTPVPTKDDVLGAVDKQLYRQFNNQTNTQTTFQNGTYIKLTDTSFAVDLGFKITNVTMVSQSNSLTFTNETYSQIEDSINSLLHDILCKPDSKQFDFPKPIFTTVGTPIRAEVMYVYKKEDINLPSAFLEEVLKVSGLLPTTVAPTTTTTTVASTTAIKTAGPPTTTTIVLPTTTTATLTSTSMSSVTSTTRFGTVMFFVRLMFQLNTPVPTKDDVLGAVDKQLYRQFNNQTNTQTTFQNGTYIKLTDTSFAVDLGFKITNVTMVSQSNSLTFTNETYSQIEDSINSLLHDILCKPDSKQFDFPKPIFTTVGTPIRAEVMYVYKKEDINLPSAFLEEVLKVSGLLPTTVAPTTTTTTVASTTAIKTAGPPTTTTIVLPTTTTATLTSTSMSSVTSTTRFGTVVVFVRLMFQLNTPVPTEDDVLIAFNKQLYNQFNIQKNTQTTFQNGTYIKLTDTSFAVNLGFKITNVTMESRSNRITFTSETYSQIEDSINSLLRAILCKPDSKQFDFPKPDFTTVGTQIRADVMYVYKEGEINLPSAILEEVLKVSGLLPTTVAPTTYSTTPLPTLLLTTPLNTTSGGGFPGWALAIIIPCGIAIILVPLWILLCCMLCGCCAAVRRRWHRRRSYNVQYTTRNGLF